jgi:hypothetical protein
MMLTSMACIYVWTYTIPSVNVTYDWKEVHATPKQNSSFIFLIVML